MKPRATSTGGQSSSRDGFNGSRLRQLQLERACSLLSVDDEQSKHDALRRWQSLSESETDQQNACPNTHKQRPAFPNGRSLNPGPKLIKASSRLGHSDDGPVVYVLPDPEQQQATTAELWTRRQANLDPFERKQEENQRNIGLNLKYPHGMPRWGPKLVSSASVKEQSRRENLDGKSNTRATHKENVEEKPTNMGNGGETSSHKTSAADEDSTTTDDSKSQKLSAIKKAEVQSKLAAARAIQHIAANAHSPENFTPSSLYHKVDNNKHRVGGLLGSGLLGRSKRTKPSSSLLESARQQQSRIMDVNHCQTIRQTVSLDDPLCHEKNNQNLSIDEERPRSVQSFEYLNNHFASTPRSLLVNRESSSSDEEDEVEDFQSWDMDTSHESIAELSIDDTASTDQSVPSNRSNVSSSIQAPIPNPQRSSLPTLIPSEVDQESSSMYSDCSSFIFNTTQGPQLDDDDDDSEMFFDSTESIRPTFSQEDRPFNAKRCRELLSKRNKYFEEEERKRLISPGAIKRLSKAPSLSRVGDENALRELKSRGRWLLSKQAHEYKVTIPAAQPPRLRQQPLASLPDDDDDFAVKPIELVAPKTMPAGTTTSSRMPSWHRPLEHVKDGDGQVVQSVHKEVENGNKHNKRVYRFSVRCVAFLSFLAWATRAFFRLQNLFLFKAIDLGPTITVDQFSAEKSSLDASILNLTFSWLLPGMTHVSMIDMPVQKFLPPPAIISTIPTPVSLPPPKCYANTTRKSFWEVRQNVEKISAVLDVQIPVLEPLQPWESMFSAAMAQDQTICDEIFQICYFSSEPLNAFAEFMEGDFLHNEVSDADDSQNDKNLLKIVGDVLRKQSQRLQEKRRRRREIYRV